MAQKRRSEALHVTVAKCIVLLDESSFCAPLYLMNKVEYLRVWDWGCGRRRDVLCLGMDAGVAGTL